MTKEEAQRVMRKAYKLGFAVLLRRNATDGNRFSVIVTTASYSFVVHSIGEFERYITP